MVTTVPYRSVSIIMRIVKGEKLEEMVCGVRFGIWDMRYEIWDVRFGIWDLGFGM